MTISTMACRAMLIKVPMDLRPWAAFWRSLKRWENEKIAPVLAVRNTIGVLAPLIVAVLFKNPVAGVVIAIGALNVMYSDGNDAYGLRARRMLLSSIVTAVAVFLGGIAGLDPVLAVILAGIWAFGAGMLVALGTAPGDLGVISLVTLVIFAAQPMHPGHALLSALGALTGGLLQTGLSLLFWPVRRFRHERSVIADLYRELGRITTLSLKTGSSPPATQRFIAAREVMSICEQDHSAECERFTSLLNQAERIRLRLLTIGRLKRRLQRDPLGPKAVALLTEYFAVVESVLNTAADLLESDSDVDLKASSLPAREELSLTTERLSAQEWPEKTPFFSALVRDAIIQMESLNGQLRSAVRLAERERLAAPTQHIPPASMREVWLRRLRNSLAVLSANFTFRSVIFRHAVRLAVCVAVGDAIARSISSQRSYWVPMTIAILLKPDFLSTISRGVLRLVGTFVGLGFATLLYHWISPQPETEVLLVGAFVFLLRWLGPAHYGVFTAILSALIVALVSLNGVLPQQVISARAVNTAIGGMLALLAYVVWPTWERSQVRETMARLLDSYRVYLRVLRASLDFGQAPGPEVNQAMQSARAARTNMEASSDRVNAEPGLDDQMTGRLNSMLASSHDFIWALMALESGINETGTAVPPILRRFLDQVEITLFHLSAALRGSRMSPNDLPELRTLYRRFLQESGIEPNSLVAVEADRMTNGLNTLAEQILNWVRPRTEPHRKLAAPAMQD